jgi:hypothetical protein
MERSAAIRASTLAHESSKIAIDYIEKIKQVGFLQKFW